VRATATPPTLGILAARLGIPGVPPFGHLTKLLAAACQAIASQGVRAVVVDPREVMPGADLRDTWTHDGKAWRAAGPCRVAAIYDRVRATDSWRDATFEAREHFAAAGIPIVNPPEFSRLTQHKLRCQEVLTRGGVPMPEAQEATEPRLHAALHAWDSVFLKPLLGHKGQGILQLSRDDGIRITRADGTQLPASHLDVLLQRIQQVPHLIQRGIEVPRIDDAPFDLRCLVQRVGDAWDVTATVARIAQPGRPVANLSAGGRAACPHQTLTRLFGATGSEVLAQVESTAQTAARCLGHEHPHIAELGLDILVDGTAGTWVIEANARPGRTALARLSRDADPHVARHFAQARLTSIERIGTFLRAHIATRQQMTYLPSGRMR
jgi:glutathione synthase/RimK-type ligase-like ATP-grasp enzyme